MKNLSEELRNWVLAVSMDQKISQTLSTDNCSSCGAEIYEACLVCPECDNKSIYCIVTGYPVKPALKASVFF